MSPILTGVIMDSFDNKHEGYKWGYIQINS